MTIVVDTDRPWVRGSNAAFQNDSIKPGDTFALADETRGKPYGIWQFDGQVALRIDLGSQHPHHPQRRVLVPQGSELVRTLVSALGISNASVTVQRMELSPRAFYRGIARPEADMHGGAAFSAPDYHMRSQELISSLLQLRSLYQELESIFDVIHPSKANIFSFGNSIINLIILACTECEAQWLAVLKLNGYKNSKPTRKDYYKLSKPMKLNEFTVILQHYRGIDPLVPFAGWDGLNPKPSLPWYDDYNALKHDRAGTFERATLGTALNSIAACWVMIAAQYGYRALRELPDLQNKMRIWYAPRWSLSECYFSMGQGFSRETAVPYPF